MGGIFYPHEGLAVVKINNGQVMNWTNDQGGLKISRSYTKAKKKYDDLNVRLRDIYNTFGEDNQEEIDDIVMKKRIISCFI